MLIQELLADPNFSATYLRLASGSNP